MANHKKQFCPKGHDTLAVGRLNGSCRVCRKEYQRAYNISHSVQQKASVKRWMDANKEQVKDSVYKRLYGISLKEYRHLCNLQNNQCLLCPRIGNLVIDHCHRTKKLRGLLCSTCNRAIGLLGDDPVRLRAGASYLEKAA